MHQYVINTVVSKFTKRTQSYFHSDLVNSEKRITKFLEGASVLVIGGAGTIGSSFIRQLLAYPLQKITVVDHNENGLAELVRQIRSQNRRSTIELKTYPISFGNPIFEDILKTHGPFDLVANFAALKHVRSEKDVIAIKAMLENNVQLNVGLINSLIQNPPKQLFCVSTDKASSPANIMGASKSLMEKVLYSASHDLNISTARFANVAFSNGSLLDSFIRRYESKQPIVCPADIKRFFVSEEEAGQLCLLASTCSETYETFIPKMDESHLTYFTECLDVFLDTLDISPIRCDSEDEARDVAQSLPEGSREHPIYLFETDTSGEKSFEQFYNQDDRVDWSRFNNLGVIFSDQLEKVNISEIYNRISGIIKSKDVSKVELVRFLQQYIHDFDHLETGRNLDQKM